ncbi:hypothetical protein THIOM_000054 [Candidatus Thiomargarita nelsonii]|uniref:Uncharacterized protein n=1 Tax=Candidatus Thiomargarita nelsonii TaxID=1003181 RepID=A0A0A6P2Q5_9GAMM|nr:hypothetical protein THIOM_000054 [Candidatus Thiomargarita nelsonii]
MLATTERLWRAGYNDRLFSVKELARHLAGSDASRYGRINQALKKGEQMINLKQKELSHQLFDHLKQQYPEIDLVDIIESGVYPVNSLGNVSCQKMRIEK